MSETNGPTPRVEYRCCACQFEFVPRSPGVAPCPRCQAIGGHDAVSTSHPGGGYGAD